MPDQSISLFQQPVPDVYPQTYLQIARQRGVHDEEIMRQTGWTNDRARLHGLSFEELNRFISLIVRRVGDEGIGLEVGWQLPPTAYGSFGYALLCCPDLGTVMHLCERFWHLNARGVAMSTIVDSGQCITEFQVPDAIREPVRHQIFETTVASIVRGFRLLLQNDAAPGEVWFPYPEPDYGAKLHQYLGHCRFNMPGCQFRFDQSLLSRPLPLANPTALRFAIEQCEREVALASSGTADISEQVQQRLKQGMEGYPSLEEMADAMHMTARTLRRRLQHSGTRYKTLLDQARRRDAVRLLDNRNLSIQSVATQLGYQDPANFTRAFRSWTGQTPREYRQTRDR